MRSFTCTLVAMSALACSSELNTAMPKAANALAIVLLPLPIPPVSPTTIILCVRENQLLFRSLESPLCVVYEC